MSSEASRKSAARKILVDNLNLTTERKSLKKLMELAGEIVKLDIFEDIKRQKAKATIVYSSSLEAQRAIQQLDGKELDGKVIVVREDTGFRRSRSPRRSNQIYIKNLPYSVTWQQLRDVFAPYGEVVRVDIPKDINERSKGFGFVQFRNDSEAIKAMNSMNNAEFNGRKIQIKHAQRKQRK